MSTLLLNTFIDATLEADSKSMQKKSVKLNDGGWLQTNAGELLIDNNWMDG